MYIYGFYVDKNSFNMDDVLCVVENHKPDDEMKKKTKKQGKKRRKQK